MATPINADAGTQEELPIQPRKTVPWNGLANHGFRFLHLFLWIFPEVAQIILLCSIILLPQKIRR
jgi:hypothetical protein